MTYQEIIKQIGQKACKPVYLLDGDEPYFIDSITHEIATKVLDEGEREFNQTVVYAMDTSPDALGSIVKRYPMMAPFQVVIVKEAQTWKSLEDLIPLVENPTPTTVLVLCFKGKTIAKNTKLAKFAKANGVHFRSEKVKPYDVTKWLTAYCKSHKVSIESRALAILAENIGNDIKNLIEAIDKLKILCPEGQSIDADMVWKNIGINKDFNEFELQEAIGARNDVKALTIAKYFAENQKEHNVIKVTIGLYYYFAKLIKYRSLKNPTDNYMIARELGVNPYFVGQYRTAARNYGDASLMRAMDILHDIDLQSKGVSNAGGSHGDLMKEMVARLLRA